MPNSSNSTYTTLIRDMPEGERPRERLAQYGAGALNNPELIAILLRTGMKGESVFNMSYRLLRNSKALRGWDARPFRIVCARRHQRGKGVPASRRLRAWSTYGLSYPRGTPDHQLPARCL